MGAGAQHGSRWAVAVLAGERCRRPMSCLRHLNSDGLRAQAWLRQGDMSYWVRHAGEHRRCTGQLGAWRRAEEAGRCRRPAGSATGNEDGDGWRRGLTCRHRGRAGELARGDASLNGRIRLAGGEGGRSERNGRSRRWRGLREHWASRTREQPATQLTRGADLRGVEERGRRADCRSGPGGSRGGRGKEIGRRRQGRSPDGGVHERKSGKSVDCMEPQRS